MINTGVFNYVNVLDKAADAAWLRNEAINSNIANADTPGYKRQDVSFQEELKAALGESKYEDTDSKVANVNLSRLEPQVYTDSPEFSYRLDKNNVDIDTENVTLAQNQIQYNALLDSIQQEFNNMKNAIRS